MFFYSWFDECDIKTDKADGCKKEIIVNENKLLIRMLLRGHSFFGLVRGKLTDKQICKIEKFTDNMFESMNKEEHNYVS